MASGFHIDTVLNALEDVGLLELALPFLLVFTIVFAVLEKTKIMGEGKKNLNVVIALVLSLSVIFAHTGKYFSSTFDPVNLINEVLPSVSILVVAIMMLLIIIGVFAHDRVLLGVTMPGWIALFSIIAIVYIFGTAAHWWGPIGSGGLEEFFGEEAVAIVIMILVFAIIIWFITGGGEKKESFLENAGFNLKKLFGDK